MNAARIRSGLVLFAVFGLLGPSARAESGVPEQVWFMKYSPKQRADRMKQFGLPKYADGTSRMEAELQANAELGQLGAINQKLRDLAANPAKAEALLGKGLRIVQVNKQPRDVWDSYRDTKDGLLAATNASLRIRSENGVDKINFKPPTAVRFGNGVAHRIESGINVLPTSDVVGFMSRSRMPDNPLREVGKLYPGRKVGEFLDKAVEIKQVRSIYEIHRYDAQGNAAGKVAEFSVDHVTARDANNPSRTVEFGRVELEGDHITLKPTAEQAARLANSTWRGPHRARDTRNPALTESPEVKEVHRLSEVLSKHLGVKPAGMSKYAEARQKLGLPAPTARAGQATRPGRAAQRAAAPVQARKAARIERKPTKPRDSRAQAPARNRPGRARVAPQRAR